MKKLRIILKSRLFFIIIILLSLFRVLDYLVYEHKSIYNLDDNSFICTVLNIYNNNKLILDCNETIYGTIDYENDVEIGDVLRINGKLEEYSENSNINLFNYKEFQKHNAIFYKLNITKYTRVGKTSNVVLKIKKYIYNRIKDLDSFSYLKSFILGDKNEINKEIIDNFKYIGIIHLFSISGMHVSFIVKLLNKIYDKKTKKKTFLTFSFLFIYYFLINGISILRSIVSFTINYISDTLKLNINKYKASILTISLLLIMRPNSIYNLGFYYSVIISSALSLLSNRIKIKKKILKPIYMALLSFLFSIPLNIYSYYEINLLSTLYNLLFIPFVSFILFPLSIATFIIPFLDSFLFQIIRIFEYVVNMLSNINSTLIFMKPSILMIVVYYVIIILSFINCKFISILLITFLIHYNFNYIFIKNYVLFFDVGQGDSSLIHYNNTNILIDTGGNANYDGISKNITIPVLKSLGIKKIDYLIISHGDYDHMGEAINLVNNFKVDKTIFNCGEFNDLEQGLIKELKRKTIKYYSCIKELNIDNNKLQFLQTREYDNENDNSNVIYIKIGSYDFMFMGDASSIAEKEIMNMYNLPNIDVLKIGHHGSKTSSSEKFIEIINPKYSIISVGKNNRYGHPNKETLDNIKDSKIYRTDQNGSVIFKIKNNKLNVEAYLF